jgi:hypothetical protein
MLRVSPDGNVVWVQTAGTNSNVMLDVENLATLHEERTGQGPVQSAFGPTEGRYGLVTHLEEPFVLVLDRNRGQEVQRIDVGGPRRARSLRGWWCSTTPPREPPPPCGIACRNADTAPNGYAVAISWSESHPDGGGGGRVCRPLR